MAAGFDEPVLQSCSVPVPATGMWSERATLYQAEVILNESDLSLAFDSPYGRLETRIMLEDLIGIRVCVESDKTAASCAVDIHSLPLISSRSWFSGNETRSRKHKIDRILFSNEKTFQQNMKCALEWKGTVMRCCEKTVKNAFFHADDVSSDDQCTAQQRKFLVLINPVAGKGKGVTLFKSQVQPLFELADIDLDIVVTDEPGHAKNLVKSYDLSQIDGIVVSSGDGLVYEVVRGLMDREDWEKAITTPIGHIPTGSGNGLCSSLLYQNKEEMSLTNAAFQIIRGGVEPVDLATVHTTANETVYMMLLANWGILADIDIESESLRCLGTQIRDYLGAIKCIIQGRTYPGRLHYLPIDAACNPPEEAVNQEADTEAKGPTEPQHRSPQRFSTILPPTPSDPLPGTWKVIDGAFTMVCPLMAPAITTDFIGHPDVYLGSGEITILYMLDDVTRWDLVSLMLEGGSGSWVNHPKIHVIKAKAYRIEPLCDLGIITVDGEVIEYGATQAEVHRQVARVFSRKRVICT